MASHVSGNNRLDAPRSPQSYRSDTVAALSAPDLSMFYRITGCQIKSEPAQRLESQRERSRGCVSAQDVYCERRVRVALLHTITHYCTRAATHAVSVLYLIDRPREKGLRSAYICLNSFPSVSHTPFVSVRFDSACTFPNPSPDPRSPRSLLCLPRCPSLDIHKSISQFHFIGSGALMDFSATVLI